MGVIVERISYKDGQVVESAAEVNLCLARDRGKAVVLDPGTKVVLQPERMRGRYSREMSVGTDLVRLGSNTDPKTKKFETTNGRVTPEGEVILSNPGDVFIIIGPGPKRRQAVLLEAIILRRDKPRRRTGQ